MPFPERGAMTKGALDSRFIVHFDVTTMMTVSAYSALLLQAPEQDSPNSVRSNGQQTRQTDACRDRFRLVLPRQ